LPLFSLLHHLHAAAATPEATGSPTRLVLAGVRIDGIAHPLRASHPVRVPALAKLTEFTIEPHSESHLHTRWRYQLEGIDPDWRDAGAWMRITARFEDKNGYIIGGEEQTVSGQSPGWTGDLAHSPAVQKQLHLEVPENAQRLIVWTCTSGLPGIEWRSGTQPPLPSQKPGRILSPHPTVGIHALHELSAILQDKRPGSPPRRHNLIPSEGHLLDQLEGTPKGWARHGTSLGFAKIHPRSEAAPLLVLRDESATSFGGWVTAPALRIPVENSAAVTLEWKDAYSIGWAGPARIAYSYLPAGHYRLRIQPLTTEGFPAGAETLVPVQVFPPFHQTLGFQILVLSLGTVGVFLITRRVQRRKLHAEVEAMNRHKALLDERLRIARDLHDSLGSDLTHLALLSDLAQRQSRDATPAPYEQIFESAKSLTRRVDEIVWALNPAQDSLPQFIDFIANHSQKFLNSAQIRCRLHLPADPPTLPLPSPIRHDLFLALKEALHNIVKHSGASEVRLHLEVESSSLRILLEDNGQGIPPNATAGNGTESIRSRIQRIGGTLNVSQPPGGGITLAFQIPLPPAK
jgi:signal transduction histidine kinase